MIILSFIQYYLVRNTYQLTKDKYYTEVRKAMSKITRLPAIVALETEMSEQMKTALIAYSKKELSRAAVVSLLNNINKPVNKQAGEYIFKEIDKDPLLKGVRYSAQLDEVVIEYEKNIDTILSSSAKPVLTVGKSFRTDNTILLDHSSSMSTGYVTTKDGAENSYLNSPVIRVEQSKYIDLSKGKLEIIKRMGGIFVLACGLIIAVMILFYLVFRALLRQKKVADIQTDFANNITHELKTPLSSVELILKSLSRQEVKSNPEKTAELHEMLNRQYYKLKQTVDSVLESAMSEEVVPTLKEVNITTYLHQYTKDLSITSHPVQVNIAPENYWLKINTISIEKVLNNLLENALKYSNEGTLITITAYAREKEYFIEIKDSGSGISAQYTSQIFNKFVRVAEQNRHTVKGLGLGLYLSKTAVQQMGGSISVNSKPGHGSTFTIKLPLHEN